MLYSAIGILAIVINLIINRDILWRKKGGQESEVYKAYRFFDYAILIYHATDVLWGIFNDSSGQWPLYVDTVVYYLAMYLAVMFWAGYVVKYLDDHGGFGKALKIAVYVLCGMEIAALVVNHFVHFFFWVDEAGDYHAYTFRYVALAIQIVMLLATSGYALAKRRVIEEDAVRARHRTIAIFGFIMAAAIVVQIFYPLLPIYSMGYMVGTCLIHSFIIEDENEELRRKADEANDAKTNFMFSMSHDIRTPMNAILGFTRIGRRHIDDKKTVEDCLTKISSSGDHLLNLINDILEMSRIETGNLELERNPVDIRDLVEKVKTMSEPLAISKSIDFAVNVADIENPYVYADELHFNEVLINLISNAIKYTDDGGKVRCNVFQTGAVAGDKVELRFEIFDTGIGMSEEFQKHIFETFSRENTSTVSRVEGTGLGLSIVKKILDKAEGSISVQSQVGKGSVFTVLIDFHVMDDQAVSQYREKKEAHIKAMEEAHFEGRKVLLVEDNEMNREIALDILKETGLVVETAEDGQIALDTVVEKGVDYYDCILMDIQMPVMNGYEATRAIRRLQGSENLPIIALSANAFAEDKIISAEAGMNDHIAKPINMAELFEALARVFRS